MTYLVYDGKALITDRLMQQTVGQDAIGRQPVHKSGYVDLSRLGEGVDIFFDDCRKMIFPEKGTYKGQRILVFAASGSVNNLGEMANALAAGVDFDAYLAVEVNVSKECRRIFNGRTSILLITEDGVGHAFTACDDGRIDVNTELPLHLGAGSDPVNGVYQMVVGPMTALECYVVASNHSDLVSRNFDYYIPATGAYVKDQRLTPRQATCILEKVQKRINLLATVKSKPYVN